MNFDGDRIFHAYIAGGGMAETLARAVVCSGSGKRPCMACFHCDKSARGIHPDIIFVGKQSGKREILVDQIRELNSDVIVVPNESEKKAYIIDDAAIMNHNSQNAFLRLLEEPPSHAVFILKTDTPDELLPTVRSRCVELKSKAEDSIPDSAISDVASSFCSAIQSGNVSLVELMFQLERLEKEQFAAFLAAAREHAASGLRASGHDEMSQTHDILSRAERALATAEQYLDFNVSVGHISGMICATLMRSADRKGLGVRD